MRVANAHNNPGPDGLKIFNIGYLAGITGILLAWNSAGILNVAMHDEYFPYTTLCLKLPTESKPFYPASIVIAMSSLSFLFSLIISKRSKKYLSKLHNSHLRNLPSKNALTYIDTLILFAILSGSVIFHSFFLLFWMLDKVSFDNLNLISNSITLIVDDIGLGFIFPIYIIIKTRRYLPKLWDDSREIIGENNDFFSTNPALVAPAPAQPQPMNLQIAESIL